MIRIRIPKGLLYLTEEEFRRALERGKRIERARKARERSLARAEKTEKAQDHLLGWPWGGSKPRKEESRG